MSDLTTKLLEANEAGIAQAAAIWQAGGLVALPTETVYGLGADARNDQAVARIFEAKARPSFNPLIVHVPDVEMAKTLVHWSETAEALAKNFWPGPLTLVLPIKVDSGLSPLVTAGLDSLAIRMPAHPVARTLLQAFGGPVAAPSANPSGKISPTQPQHVIDGLSGRIEAVVDGGACGVGLESTILGLLDEPTLLRPGGIPAEELSNVLGTDIQSHQAGDAITAPGQMTSHYAPGASVRLNALDQMDGEVMLGFGDIKGDLNLSPDSNLREAAANLFHFLRRLDAGETKAIAVAPIPATGLGLAINDRLQRAAAPR